MTVAPARARSGWILSSGWDMALFIGAPALCILTLVPMRSLWPSAAYSAFLLAFFTFGHHLPGFLRVYGDRELFRQYKWRFLIAPPLVFACALWYARADLHGLLFLVFTWDIWHVLMQHYGFMRIYDAKRGRTGAVEARLDRAISLVWYLTLIALSPYYTHNLLLRGYSTGIPAMAPQVLGIFRETMTYASVGAALAYAGYQAMRWRKGIEPNWRKLALLATFIGATWYLYIALDDFQVGFAVWSAFHCIQYYGIVWAFNRNRIRNPAVVTSFIRFLFQPGFWMVAGYLGLIFAYGGINYAAQLLPASMLQQLLMAFVVTSGTLHYYYDGFIWKMRDPETSRDLDIAPVKRQAARPVWMQGAVQAAYLVAALAVLSALEAARRPDEIGVRRELTLAVPELPDAHLNFGDALRRNGRLEEAAKAYREAVRAQPASAQARNNLGLTLVALGRSREATAEFERAIAADPQFKAAHYNLASLLAREGDTSSAMAHFRAALPEGDDRSLRELERSPEGAEVLNNMGLALLQTGGRAAGVAMLRRAVAANPRHAPAQLNLASALVLEGRIPEARDHYRDAIREGDPAVRASAERALRSIMAAAP
jgi:Tfp pilus assembly protein PilF/multidrug transporter EmrE-like cation transporter